MLDKLAKLYGVSIDAIVHMKGEVPKEIVIEDKTTSEQMRLIQELDKKDKGIIFSMIDIMLTKSPGTSETFFMILLEKNWRCKYYPVYMILLRKTIQILLYFLKVLVIF